MKMWKYLLIGYILLLYSAAEELVVKDASYKIKTVSSFGLDVTYAEHKLVFNKELGFTVPTICPGFDCSTQDAVDTNCLCNYASRDPSVCGIIPEDCPNTCNMDLCNFDEEWIEIKQSEYKEFVFNDPAPEHWNEFSAVTSPERFIRFYVTDKCSGIRFLLKRITGSVWFSFINENGEVPFEWNVNDQFPFSQHVCPHDATFQLGTWFIIYQIDPFSFISGAIFELTFGTFPVAAPPSTPESCTPIDPDTTCLIPETAYTETFAEDRFFFYSYTQLEDSCDVIGFKVTALLSDSVESHLFSRGDLYLFASFTGHPAGVSENSDYYSALSSGSDKMFVVNICHAETLYIRVESPINGNDFPFEIVLSKDDSNWIYRPLGDYSPFDAYNSLQNSALYFPDKDKTTRYTCDNIFVHCDNFFVPSQTAPQIFYPFTRVISERISLIIGGVVYYRVLNQFESLLHNVTLLSHPEPHDPKAFIFIVILDTKSSSMDHQVTYESALTNSKIKLLGPLRGINGEILPIEITGFKEDTTIESCNAEAFDRIHAKSNEYLDLLAYSQDLIKIPSLTWVYLSALNILKNSDTWKACSTYVDSLVSTDTKTVNRDIVKCPYTIFDPEYDQDPCCSPIAAYESLCVPSSNPVEVVTYSQNLAATEQCQSSTCISSFLDDYISNRNTGSSCDDRTSAYQDKFFQNIMLQRECRVSIFGGQGIKHPDNGRGVHCERDSDCPGSTCNFLHRTCNTSYALQVRQYVTCLYENMSQPQKEYIFKRYGLSASDSNIIDELLAAWKPDSPDCLWGSDDIAGIPVWKSSGYYLPDTETYDFNAKYLIGPDLSFPFPYSPGYLGQRSEVPDYLPPSYSCERLSICNHDSSLCSYESFYFYTRSKYRYNLTACQVDCGEGEHACMICHDSTHCDILPIADESSCTSSSVCIYPGPDYNEYVTGLTRSQCEDSENPSCSHYDPKCVSYSYGYDYLCFDVEIDETTCTNRGGAWSEVDNPYPLFYDHYCAFSSATDASSCTSASATAVYQTCATLSNYDCANCWNWLDCAVNYDVLYCYVDPYALADPDTCTTLGNCVGEEELLPLQEDLLGFMAIAAWGGCVFPKYADDYDLVAWCGLYAVPYEDQCVYVYDFENYYISDVDTCESLGGQWQYPSTNRATCESRHGCYELDPNRYMGMYSRLAFSSRNEQDCNKTLYGEWKLFKTWNQGKHIQPTWRSNSLKWTQKHATLLTRYTDDALYFGNVYADLLSATSYETAVEARAASLCDLAVTTAITTTVVCDCLSDASECFQDELIPTSVTRLCPGSLTTASTETVSLYFDQNSVDDCSIVTLSKVSAELLKDERLSLSSAFANFRKNTAYAVKNAKAAVVGNLIGDGVEITFDSPVKKVRLCFLPRNEVYDNADMDAYPIFDIGYAYKELKEVLPLGVTVTQDGDTYCGELTNLKTDLSYFPILRLKNYENKENRYFEKDTEGLLYTLAALFLVTSLLGLGTLSYFVKKGIMTRQLRFQQLFLVIFLLAFVIIRCIYFFIVPSGITSVVLDYILVVLPTFFYFTAFTMLVAGWAVVSTAEVAKLKNALYYINLLSLIMNIIIYITFIIIVLIFNFEHPGKNEVCGRRFISQPSNKIQKSVYYAYAAIIAFFSLAIAIGFAYFGFAISRRMHQTAKALRVKRGAQKTTIVTIIGVIGFLLHCLFILIQVSLNKSVVIFNFIAIVITEILPAIAFFTLQFNFSPTSNGSKRIITSISTTETATSSTAITSSAFQSTTSSELSTFSDAE